MTSPVIRNARPADIGWIAALDAGEYGSDAYPRIFFRQAFDLWPSLLLVAESAGSVAGYALGAVGETAGDAWLLAMVVAPQVRGQGVGRALVAGLLDRIRDRGPGRVLLTVHPGNSAAIGLYHSSGFQQVGDESDYFGPGEPRLVLALNVGRDDS